MALESMLRLPSFENDRPLLSLRAILSVLTHESTAASKARERPSQRRLGHSPRDSLRFESVKEGWARNEGGARQRLLFRLSWNREPDCSPPLRFFSRPCSAEKRYPPRMARG